MDREHFFNVLLQWFDGQKGCNVHFVCPDSENPDQKQHISANTNILAMASEFFNAKFYGTMAITNMEKVIEIPFVFSTFKLLLSFIYGRTITFETIEIARDFYEAADYYICKDACDYGMKQFFKMLKPVNAIVCYEMGHIYNNKRLKDAAWKFIRLDERILERRKFLEASPEIVVDLFQKQERLKVKSDKEFVIALEHYIAYNKESDPDIASKIRPAIQRIAFLTLTPEDIRNTTLLSDNEKDGILANIGSNQVNDLMPDGFSKCIVSMKSTHEFIRSLAECVTTSEEDESSDYDNLFDYDYYVDLYYENGGYIPNSDEDMESGDDASNVDDDGKSGDESSNSDADMASEDGNSNSDADMASEDGNSNSDADMASEDNKQS